MTEQEWLQCEQPADMLDHLAAIGLGDDERLRRFIGTYLNQSRHALADEPIAARWDVVDRLAAGTADLAEFSSAIRHGCDSVMSAAKHVVNFTAWLVSGWNRRVLENAACQAYLSACEAAEREFSRAAREDPVFLDSETRRLDESGVEWGDPLVDHPDGTYAIAVEKRNWNGVPQRFIEAVYRTAWAAGWKVGPEAPWFATWDAVERLAALHRWPDLLTVAMTHCEVLECYPEGLPVPLFLPPRPRPGAFLHAADGIVYLRVGHFSAGRPDWALDESLASRDGTCYKPLELWEHRKQGLILLRLFKNPFRERSWYHEYF